MMARQMIGGHERQSGRTPWRTVSVCVERKALMATDICAWSGEAIKKECCCSSTPRIRKENDYLPESF